MRIGFGYDAHPLVSGRRLVLGGVEIGHDRGLAGHSDADALVHAIADAILGALAQGDLGGRFPDTDPRWAGVSSLEFLRDTAALAADHGYAIANVDTTVVLETPRLAPHIPAMRDALSAALGVEAGLVSVKATRNERMGFVGREEGACAYAVVLLTPVGPPAPPGAHP